MSKKICLFSFVLLALVFASCSETEEVSRYDNWQARSEAFIDSIANVCNSAANQALADDDPEKIHALKDETNDQWIYVKKIISIEEEDINKYPVYTSTISAYYRMFYFNGDVVQQNFSGTEPGDFDSPSEFTVSGLISGWQYSLMHMTEGEYWTLYIPYQSGYGSGTGSDGSLQPYSALVYNVKLVKIVER
jgi:FKBP-type peptidyl-prolyl cis-trans isomerases 1